MRKLFVPLVSSIVLWYARTAAGDPLIQPKDTLAICGDSITAQHQYSAFIEDYLLMCQPKEELNVAQFGWGGEQAPGFLSRMESDLFPFKPTVATTCYGMNDGHYLPLTDETADRYRKAQTDIVELMKKRGVRTIVLGSPKCVDSYYFRRGGEPTPDVYNQTLSSLAGIDKDIAAKEGVVYADVFGSTMDAMKKAKAQFGEAYSFAGGDGVHPDPNGHLVMAYAFLKALGCTGDIATITIDLDHNRAEATAGQEVLSCKDGSVDLESTRYPFCFSGSIDKAYPGDTANMLKCVSFNEDLNRYVLVVKGLKTVKATVTWGNQSKDFNAADLGRGINLAAEFLDNPFRNQFFRVNNAVQVQEEAEEILVQDVIHAAPFYAGQPMAADAFSNWEASGKALREALCKQASALVIPIRHTIRVQPIAALVSSTGH